MKKVYILLMCSAVALLASCAKDNDTQNIKVSSVTFTPASQAVQVGTSVTLQVSVLPENASCKTLTWISSNNEIASVDNNGVVYGEKEGSTTITAVTQDGSGISANCTVVVSADPVPPTPPTPSDDPVLVDLSKAVIKTNAPMQYSTWLSGCDENGMGGSCNWVNWFYKDGERAASDNAKKEGRRKYYDVVANLYDDDEKTSFHTNTDWNDHGDDSWPGERASANFGSHLIQVTLPASAPKLNVYLMNDSCPADNDHTCVIGSEGVNIYAKSLSGKFKKLGNYKINGAETSNTIEGLTLPDNAAIAELRFERATEVGWTFTGNNFGFAEMKIWTIGQTGEACKPSPFDGGGDDPTPPSPGRIDPVNRPSAPSGYKELDLSTCEISNNNAMQYVNYGFSTADGWLSTNSPITSEQRKNRKALYDNVENMWDSDKATSFHTNFDVYDSNWNVRSGAIVTHNYIMVKMRDTCKVPWHNVT